MVRVDTFKDVIYAPKAPIDSQNYRYCGSGIWVKKEDKKEVIGTYSQPSNDEFIKKINEFPKEYKKVK